MNRRFRPPGPQRKLQLRPRRKQLNDKAVSQHSLKAEELPLFSEEDEVHLVSVPNGERAIETDGFPFEQLSVIAEAESWRKEIYRPPYHIHKWWAQRLGSVFRAIVLGSFAPPKSDLMKLFYGRTRINNAVVFDPFMGSGTTLGEATKLGARAIGRDINPVSHFLVKNALSKNSFEELEQTLKRIEERLADNIRYYYQTRLSDGQIAEVLYYFWVKVVNCPKCEAPVELFSKRIFANHAYPKKNPHAQASCPTCGAVNGVNYDQEAVTCSQCGCAYNPQKGNVSGQNCWCPGCGEKFKIVNAVRANNEKPNHRLYAKLVLMPDGTKQYQSISQADIALFREATEKLNQLAGAYPVVKIAPGHNTDQAIGYNYRHWHQMFNERQLFCISMLANEIRKIPDKRQKELFACLFSGMLEFNNQFTSFKGEGTGAVRHMFAHHILKPERVPLEANPWGTPKSSGSFTTMMKGRIRRALEYAEEPFEIRVRENGKKREVEKVFGLSRSMGQQVAESYHEFGNGSDVFISCGDSASTPIDDLSVDAVITDPPFFDNVNYSQLADFFYVWLRHILGDSGGYYCESTRSDTEVQNSDAKEFSYRLESVWKEAVRVLKNDGVLVFTYHHSRSDGWSSILSAIIGANLHISAVQPIKSEMSVAMPKHQAKEPIDLDIIVVCRKQVSQSARKSRSPNWETAKKRAAIQIQRFNKVRRFLSRNDVRIVLTAQLIKELSILKDVEDALSQMQQINGDLEQIIEEFYENQTQLGDVGN